MDMKGNRNELYDTIKGVAILLVVIGHTIQTYNNDFDNNVIFRVIYSFHMPLFMFVSGIVVPLGRNIDWYWVKRKFTQLVIPFVVWIFLPFLFSNTKDWNKLIIKIGNIIKHPDNGGYWFLWVLFLCCFFLWIDNIICKKYLIKNEIIILLGEIISLFLIGQFIIPWFGIKSLAYHSVYYFAGYFVGKYQLLGRIKHKKISIFLGITMYVALVPMWYRAYLPSWLQPFAERIPTLIVMIMDLAFDYIVAFLGILTVWVLVKYALVKMHSILAVLGRFTLEIYILHYYFIGMFSFDNKVITVIVNSIVSLSLSWLLADCMESGKIVNLLFGKSTYKSRNCD